MVDVKSIERAAVLSGIHLEAHDHDRFISQVSKVFEWVETLQELDIDKLEPMANPMEEFQALQMPLRQDTVDCENNEEALMDVAPQSSFNMYKVPKVVE